MEPAAGESTAAGATFSMSSKRRGLGRGLDALLGASAGAHVAAAVSDGQLREVPVDLIERGRFQPRMHIAPEALE